MSMSCHVGTEWYTSLSADKTSLIAFSCSKILSMILWVEPQCILQSVIYAWFGKFKFACVFLPILCTFSNSYKMNLQFYEEHLWLLNIWYCDQALVMAKWRLCPKQDILVQFKRLAAATIFAPLSLSVLDLCSKLLMLIPVPLIIFEQCGKKWVLSESDWSYHSSVIKCTIYM